MEFFKQYGERIYYKRHSSLLLLRVSKNMNHKKTWDLYRIFLLIQKEFLLNVWLSSGVNYFNYYTSIKFSLKLLQNQGIFRTDFVANFVD
ncbi:unnamed protein product [Allacma fusca]|uniref:Maturase K n=1 Tax=Allacma fusca TaxID=39272 RepID=A0A8J2P1V1_9HEXA|nr:unnamed protein product [Allacma fusca]